MEDVFLESRNCLGCGSLFLPARERIRHCSRTCYQREWVRLGVAVKATRKTLPDAEIARAYESGVSAPDLARRYGVSRSRIYSGLKRLGVSMRASWESGSEKRLGRRAEQHQSWKGGRYVSGGYVWVYAPHHPLANSDGHALEHRMVYWDAFGPFPFDARIRHINGERSDNRLENLHLSAKPRPRERVSKRRHLQHIVCAACSMEFKPKAKSQTFCSVSCASRGRPRRKRASLPEETIVALYTNGMGCREIAERYGVDVGTIYSRLVSLGVSMRQRGVDASRALRAANRRGSAHWNFKGGRYVLKGYVYLLNPEHPLATKRGYIAEHRMVWYDANGPIAPGWFIHHKNGMRSDNRLENLEAMSPSAHSHHHDPDKIAGSYRKALEDPNWLRDAGRKGAEVRWGPRQRST